MDQFQYFENLANEKGKFALEVGYVLSGELQQTLEDAQVSGRVTLLDVTPLAHMPGRTFRVFKINSKAK